MLECVPNVSEGRDQRVLDELAAACGDALIDLHSDPDHNRSVFTIAGEVGKTRAAAEALAAAVAGRVSIVEHAGVHPRLGALDVVPFVALDPELRAEARTAALEFGTWWSANYGVPVFFYDDADGTGRTLPAVRRNGFRACAPDVGPDRPHATLGATAVGTRRPLVAINCVLSTADVGVARDVTTRVRERDGGLPGVRALVFVVDRDRVQVSMNLVDLDRTGVEAACTRVRELRARARLGRRRSGTGGPAAGFGARALLEELQELGRTRPFDDDRRPARGLDLGAGDAAPGEGALAADPAPFTLRHAAPDAELLAVPQCVLQAFGLHLAPVTHPLRLLGGGAPFGKEQVRVDAQAVGSLLPAPIALVDVEVNQHLSHRLSPCSVPTRRVRPYDRSDRPTGLAPANAADGITTMSSLPLVRAGRKGDGSTRHNCRPISRL